MLAGDETDEPRAYYFRYTIHYLTGEDPHAKQAAIMTFDGKDFNVQPNLPSAPSHKWALPLALQPKPLIMTAANGGLRRRN